MLPAVQTGIQPFPCALAGSILRFLLVGKQGDRVTNFFAAGLAAGLLT